MIKEAIQHYKQSHGYSQFSPRCVLFDMDGVLYNSMPNHAVAWHEAMKQFGIHFTADDSYATEGARGVDTIRKYVLEQQGKEISSEEAQRMYDVKTEIFHHMPIAEIFPGVIDIMQKIKSAGMTIGVVTGSGQRPLINVCSTTSTDFSPKTISNSIRRRARQTKPRPLPDGTAQDGQQQSMARHRR